MIPNTEIAAIPSIILKKRSRHRSNFLRTDISSTFSLFCLFFLCLSEHIGTYLRCMSRCTFHTAHTLLCDKPLPSIFLLADLPVAYSLYTLRFQNLIIIFHDLGTIVPSVVKALYQTIDNIRKTCCPFFLLFTAQSCNGTACSSSALISSS